MKLISFSGSRGLKIVKGEGQYVWDEHGKKYLDFHTGHGVAFLGHRNKIVIEHIKMQMDEIMTLTPSFYTRIRDEMLEELDKVKPKGLESVCMLNSGSEAVELALKIARKVTRKKKLVAFKNSFHGRTFAALSVTWNRRYREPFEPLLGDVIFADFNNAESLKSIGNDVAAIIVEPVQGEGGVVPAEVEFMKELSEVAESKGALLIIDEIQSGFGRTGKLWAHEHFGISPDIMTAGKSMGGGFPVSAVFLRDEIASKLEEGDHGSTFGGNPLAMAAVTGAIKALKLDNAVEKAEEKGRKLLSVLKDNLKHLRLVRQVRGLGLMIGVELRVGPSSFIEKLQNEGLLSLKAGSTVIRFLPPYLISDDDISFAAEKLNLILQE